MRDVYKPYRGILLDAYGVFWGGNDLIPGAKETMESLVAAGKVVGILSNATQINLKEKFLPYGLIEGRHYHFLLTSGQMVNNILAKGSLPFKTEVKKYFLFGGLHPKYASHNAIFQGTEYVETQDIGEADFIYIPVPHINGEDQLNPELFHDQVKGLGSTELPMLCANPDRFAQEGSPPRFVVRQGSIAALYEKLGGQVFYYGKPSREAFEIAMGHFRARGLMDPKEILMVGDTPETDIRGANGYGMASALVTETGVFSGTPNDLLASDYPDHFIDRL